MPKIIDVSKEKILDVTDGILRSDGYKAVSIRKIAGLCKMATGTLYRYFESKDVLIASTVARTWRSTLDEMTLTAATAADFCDGMASFYIKVDAFLKIYGSVFSEYSKSVGSHDALASKHILLREQLSERVYALAEKTGQTQLLPHSDMLTECLLATLNQKDMNENTLTEFVRLIVNNQHGR